MSAKTILTETVAELEAKGSRFLAHLVPIAAFEARLDALRTEHRKANHHVTASRRMDEMGRVLDQASDDGEPAGTSGMPTLRVLIGADLVEAGVIVVRYFGGTKLGTGGLARAYSGAAARAIEAASPVQWHRRGAMKLRVPFALTSDVERLVEAANLDVISREFDEQGSRLQIEGPETTLSGIDWPRGVEAKIKTPATK